MNVERVEPLDRLLETVRVKTATNTKVTIAQEPSSSGNDNSLEKKVDQHMPGKQFKSGRNAQRTERQRIGNRCDNEKN